MQRNRKGRLPSGGDLESDRAARSDGHYHALPPQEPVRQLATRGDKPAKEKPDDAQTKTITIDAFGGKADVYQKGDKVCETPCPLNVRLGENVTVMLHRSNSEDTSETFTVGRKPIPLRFV